MLSVIKPVVRRAWERSMSEEVLSALYLIAALQAWNCGIKWLAWLLFVKAALDAACALTAAVYELSRIRKG